jgi:integrase/recombinase XerD
VKVMINCYAILSRPPVGPLAVHLCSFDKSLAEQGYSVSSRHRQVFLSSCFSHWLEKRHLGLLDVTLAAVERFIRCRARRTRIARGDSVALLHLIDFLRRQNVVPEEPEPAHPPTPAETCAQVYEMYLRNECCLANQTVVAYLPFIRDFLKTRFSNDPVMLSSLVASDVIGFVQREARRLNHAKRAKLMTCALRSFLRYGRFVGAVTLDLAAAVPVVANWSMPDIPRAIPADQVAKLLSSIDRSSVVGRRDYAVLLLLARLGIRASEVAMLDLDDIDWEEGILSVRGKGGQRTELPLPTDVGQAVAEYLQSGRPASPIRRVFLRARAPIRGFIGPCAICSIVQHAIQRSGVAAPTFGAHQFRHGLATEMLRHGASLGEIGEVLGHRHPQTTKIYTKVDITALRELALPWPGEAP